MPPRHPGLDELLLAGQPLALVAYHQWLAEQGDAAGAQALRWAVAAGRWPDYGWSSDRDPLLGLLDAARPNVLPGDLYGLVYCYADDYDLSRADDSFYRLRLGWADADEAALASAKGFLHADDADSVWPR